MNKYIIDLKILNWKKINIYRTHYLGDIKIKCVFFIIDINYINQKIDYNPFNN